MKCPRCVEDGQRSKVYDNGSTSGGLGWTPHYDEDGNYHRHNPSKVTSGFKCSNGHYFSITRSVPCPRHDCDFGKAEAAGTMWIEREKPDGGHYSEKVRL
jgi:hypothetical protein